MFKRLIIAAIMLSVLALPAIGLAADAADLIAKGDALYAERADQAKAVASAEAYRQAWATDPKNVTAAWKLTRSLYFASLRQDKDAAMQSLDEAIKAGEKAVELKPDSVAAQYWVGACYGTFGQLKGVLKSLSLVDPIKKAMAEVIKRDPGYESGGAYMILGRLYFKVPGFFGGDNQKAIENLKLAIKYGPDRAASYIYLAEVYLDEDEYDQAQKYLDQGLTMACPAKFVVSCDQWKKEGEEVKAKLAKARD